LLARQRADIYIKRRFNTQHATKYKISEKSERRRRTQSPNDHLFQGFFSKKLFLIGALLFFN
jgi:hypothetical protein